MKSINTMKKLSQRAANAWLGSYSSWVADGRRIYMCGAYRVNGEIHLFNTFHGHSLDANVYNGIPTVDLKDIVQDWLDGQRSKADTVNRIVDAVNSAYFDE